MVPNKMVTAAKAPAQEDLHEGEASPEVTGITPVTNGNRRKAPASLSAAADRGSPLKAYVVDAEDTDNEDAKSDNKDVAVDSVLNKLSMFDEVGVEVTTTPTGRYNTNIEKHSLSDKANVAAKSTPSERMDAPKYKIPKNRSPGNETFIQNAAGVRGEDPFLSAYKQRNRKFGQAYSAEGTPTSSHRAEGSWRPGRNSQNSETPTRGGTHTPGEDGRVKISGQNAQSHYSPSACIFVANLSSNENETELEAAVTRTFRNYGMVFVKIRRDQKNMPYAFCQFTRDSDATDALMDGKGRQIHGRPVRIERARANRMFSFRRISGNPVSAAECQAALEQYGNIEHIWHPNEEQVMVLNLHGAVLMQFELFDAGKHAQQGIRNQGVYLLEPVEHPSQPLSRSASRRNQHNSQGAADYIKQYDHERASIWVSGLPVNFTDQKMRSIFEPYGTIVSSVIYRKPSTKIPGSSFTFGFVEFTEPEAAVRAIAAKDNFLLEGNALKVKPKNTDHRNESFRSSAARGPAAPYRSPPAMHAPDAHSQQVFPHYGPNYMQTPPSYGYGGYYTTPYNGPYWYTWPNGQPFGGPPPVYHGVVPAAPTPNPMFTSAFPAQVDYNGQVYPQGSYAFAPYSHPGATAATPPVQQYQSPDDNDTAPTEEQTAETQ